MEPDITVSTTVLPHEDAARVIEAVRGVFPQWECDFETQEREFPIEDSSYRLTGRAASLDHVLDQAEKNRILDTAFDAMTQGTIVSIQPITIRNLGATVRMTDGLNPIQKKGPTRRQQKDASTIKITHHTPHNYGSEYKPRTN